MPFEPVTSEKLSHGVVRQIEELILRGVLSPGDRLPAERDLAERLAVSRPSLREALGALQESGLLVARAGAGVFVADVLGSAFSPALIDLFARHDRAVFDTLAFRRDMEGLAAERAARQGSDADLAVIAAIFARMEAGAGRDAEAEAALDAQFHLAIVEAGHNVVLLHMMRSMYDLLRGGVFYNRKAMFARGGASEALLEQHRAINEALQRRDAPGARAAVVAHLDRVEAALVDQRRAAENEAVARRRLQQVSGG